jgi:hypothetical protein
MEHKTLNRIIGLGVFLATLIVYTVTLSPTVVFWDVGEFCAAAYKMQVPHPPGAPLFLLVNRLASMIPYSSDIAVRMHFISALTAAFSIMFLYLITIRFITTWRGIPDSFFDKVAVYGSTVIGSLGLAYSCTYWFNAVEAEVYGISMCFVAGILWLGLRWYERAEQPHSDIYLLLIAYLIGLAVGVHLLAILTLFSVMMLVYFRFHKGSLKEFFTTGAFVKFGIAAAAIFGIVYPGVVKWLPSMLDGEMFGIYNDLWIVLAIGLVLGGIYAVYYSIKTKNRILNIASLSFLLIVLGYSTYVGTYIRANATNLPMNENAPATIAKLVSYLNREQYGSAPFLQRRFSNEPEQVEAAKKYTSDMDFLWRFQMYHMYLRYFGWNFIGREGDWKEAGISWKQLYGIPFLLGLFGCFVHWKRDQKNAFIMTTFFLIMGTILVLYFNMQEPQPRERDYFYVGSFFVFAMWISMGILGILDFLKEKLSQPTAEYAAYGALALAVVFVPANMLRTNYHEANRKGNYVAWDYSYNLLQSCEKDAILITNGDNDTFPLWYLQDVEGIRTDVRVVNLSLVNTPWYIMQLKHNTPHGSKKVPISLTDEDIANIQPIQFDPRVMALTVPRSAMMGWDPETKNPTALDIVDTLKFYMANTLEIGKVKGLRVQDIMVYDIVRTSNWQRPIYFAMTVSDEGKIGLRDYIEMQGLAFKLVPKKSSSFWANLNEQKVVAHLFNNVTNPSKEPQLGYRWRGLNDSTVYYDEDIRRLMTNYRQAFIAYALYVSNVKNKPNEVSKILDRMEEVVPHNVIDMDYRLKSDVAQFYNMAGNKEKSKEFLRDIIRECEPMAKAGVMEQISQYNPYILLLQAYESLEQYDDALRVLDRLKIVYAGTQGLDQFLEMRRQGIMAMKSSKDSTAKSPLTITKK